MKARLVSMLASTTLAAAATATATLGMSAPAHAVPYPGPALYIYSQGAVQNPSNNLVYGHAASFDTPDGSAVPPGATVTVTYASCGQVLQSATYGLNDAADGDPGSVAFLHYFSATGAPEPQGNAITDKIGPVLDWSAAFTYPGYDPYVVSNSYSGYTVKRPSCEEILSPGSGEAPTVAVQSWSVKKGATRTAKVGKSLGVTPTRATGSKVTYAWKVGTKTVDRDRVLFVKKTYKGKKVTMRVTVSKTGAKSESKTLRYGTAR